MGLAKRAQPLGGEGCRVVLQGIECRPFSQIT